MIKIATLVAPYRWHSKEFQKVLIDHTDYIVFCDFSTARRIDDGVWQVDFPGMWAQADQFIADVAERKVLECTETEQSSKISSQADSIGSSPTMRALKRLSKTLWSIGRSRTARFGFGRVPSSSTDDSKIAGAERNE